MRPILRWVWRLSAAGGGLLLGILAFNFVVMPLLVRQGKQVEVPALEGFTISAAVEELQAFGLAVRDTLERPNATVPAGLVMDQEPPAGSVVKPDRSVRLLVSRGGEQRQVPNLSGQTVRYARLTLGGEGYTLGNVIKVPSDRVQHGFVVASDPPPGTQLRPGQKVHLLISSGPSHTALALPDLRGRRLSRVEEQLRAAGFKVESQRERASDTFGELMRVVETSPGPGAKVFPGDTIVLFGG